MHVLRGVKNFCNTDVYVILPFQVQQFHVIFIGLEVLGFVN